MPLMVYIGDRGQTRRTPNARAKRAANVDARGWGVVRRQAFRQVAAQGAAISGGGAQSSGAQQVAAIRGRGAQTSSGYGSRSTSGWSWNKKAEWSTHGAKWTGWRDTNWSQRSCHYIETHCRGQFILLQLTVVGRIILPARA